MQQQHHFGCLFDHVYLRPPPPPVSPTLSKVDELHLMTPDREEILQLTEPLLLHPAQEMNKNPQVRFDFESSV